MTQAVAAPSAAPATALPDTPYVGLTPFTEQDAPFFFGREKERRVIAANLMASRLTLLYGASGVGKSSILRAGVVRDLKERARRDLDRGRIPEWIPVVFSAWRDDPLPGIAAAIADAVETLLGEHAPAAPVGGGHLDALLAAWVRSLDELSAAVEDAQSLEPDDLPRPELLVILDQFEQYFLYHGDEDGEGTFAVEFPRAVNREDLRVNFLISLREDAYARLDRFEGRILNLFESNLRIEHLDRTAARAAIEKPIESYNAMLVPEATHFAIEPELVDAVIGAVRAGSIVLGTVGEGLIDVPGTEQTRVETPFLQLVMTRLWEEERRRGSQVLHKQTLDDLGGAEQIVRTHLDEAIAALDASERTIAARVFRQLVTPSGAKITHRASDLAGYAGVAETTMLPILDKLDAQRILRSVDPAPGETSPRFEIRHDVLAAAILEWSRQYEEEQERAALEVKQREQLEEERRRARARLVFRAGVAIFVLFLISLGFGLLALILYRDADTQSQKESSRAGAARAYLTLLSGGNPNLAVKTAAQAYHIFATPDAEEALRAALVRTHRRAVLRTGHAPVQSASFSADGRLVVTGGQDAITRVWNAETGARVGRLLKNPVDAPSGERPWVNTAKFGPAGEVITASDDGRVRIWDWETGILADEWRASAGPVLDATFAPTGDAVVTASADGKAQLWTVTKPHHPVLVARGRGQMRSASFDPSGRLIVTANDDGIARVVPVGGARAIQLPQARLTPIQYAAFDTSGKRVVTTSVDGTIEVWKLSAKRLTGSLLLTMNQNRETVNRAVFSKDGSFIATGGRDQEIGKGSLRIWDAHTGALLQSLPEPGVNSVDFSDRDRLVAVATDDGTVKVLDLDTRDLPVPVESGHLGSSSVAFSPNGSLLATANGRLLRLWALPDLRNPRVLRGHAQPIESVAFSRDGALVLSASLDAVRLRSVATGKDVTGERPLQLPAAARNGQPARFTGASFSPDGKLVVAYGTAGNAGGIWVWKADGTLLHSSLVRGTSFLSALVGRDDRLLLELTSDGVVRLTRLDSGEEVTRLRLGPTTTVTSAALSPDGTLVLTGNSDGSATFWNLKGGLVNVLHVAPPQPIAGVAFSRDGKFVLTRGRDGQVVVWEAGSLQKLLKVRSGSDDVRDAIFSPDDRTIATAAADGTRLYPCDACLPIRDLERLGNWTSRELGTGH